MSHPIFRIAAAALSATAALAVAPALALATDSPQARSWDGQSQCVPLPTTQPFAKIDGDANDYSLAPGGGFEVGDQSWTLRSGAKFVGGNESLALSTGKRSLYLPLAGSATSPKFCVDETNPHFRFAYKVEGLAAGFVARVTYEREDGLKSTQLFSSQALKIIPSKWLASPVSPLGTLLPLNGGTATVQVQLVGANVTGTNSLASYLTNGWLSLPSVTIDSVMIDPYRRS